jgi:SsrA-binding protein
VAGVQAGRRQVIVTNRRARHKFAILDTYEAGIVLAGCEVKSIRAGRVSLSDAYCSPESGELWLVNMHVAPYPEARDNPEPKRKRRLLLHKDEILRLTEKINERGLTAVPLSVYFERGYAKVEIGLGRGKKLYDKREAIAEREAARQARRAMTERGRTEREASS